MNSSEFVGAIIEACRDSAVSDVISTLNSPPGRKPSGELVELSVWFSSLPAEQQARIAEVIRMAADQALFGVLCVLDGVRTIEHSNEKSVFRLTAIKGKIESIVSPGKEFLHDLYRSHS